MDDTFAQWNYFAREDALSYQVPRFNVNCGVSLVSFARVGYKRAGRRGSDHVNVHVTGQCIRHVPDRKRNACRIILRKP